MVLCCIYIFRDEVITSPTLLVQIQKAFIRVHSKRGEVEGNTMIIDQRAFLVEAKRLFQEMEKQCLPITADAYSKLMDDMPTNKIWAN